MYKSILSEENRAIFSIILIVILLFLCKDIWVSMQDKPLWNQIICLVCYMLAIVFAIKDIKKAFWGKTSD